jgi:NADH-quinone oxidoreductase E subunit
LHFPFGDGTKHVIIRKKPNILEKLLQIIAGEPIGEYNPSISKQYMLSGELCYRRQNMQSNKEVFLDKTTALKICESMGRITSDSLIPILQQIQDAYGYLPAEILSEVSKHTGLNANQMYGVATFYEQFHLEPRGRHTIKCCRGTACHVRGGREIISALERELEVEEGQTTEDMRFTFETVACLGTCFLAPVIMINNDYYGNVKPGKIKSILDRYE